MNEGNIISFKVFVDNKGRLMTEYSKLPTEEIEKVFNFHDTPLIRKILTELEPRLNNLHSKLEDELGALR